MITLHPHLTDTIIRINDSELLVSPAHQLILNPSELDGRDFHNVPGFDFATLTVKHSTVTDANGNALHVRTFKARVGINVNGRDKHTVTIIRARYNGRTLFVRELGS